MSMRTSPTPHVERVALVGLITGSGGRALAEPSLNELGGLARAAGGTVVSRTLQERERPDPATYIGSGKLSGLVARCESLDVEAVLFDDELDPAQLRHIQDRVPCKVLDRTQLILDIFARRARTREGRLQVELAQLKYLLPRLIGARTALSRLGGGIGTRGPGETKLESDRRRIRARISRLDGQLDVVRRRRLQSRERRRKREVPTVALVGYTNAGKTTLFNRLAGAHAVASDALFVTLDPLVRRIRLANHGEFVLTDTVGFLDRLPHALVAAFRATLEEVAQADVVVHVSDAAATDRRRRDEAVRRVLTDVGASDLPTIQVFSKTDLLAPADARHLCDAHPDAVAVSAQSGEGMNKVLERLTVGLGLDSRRVSLAFDRRDADDQRRLALVYRIGHVVRCEDVEGRVMIEADLHRRVADRWGALAEPV